MKQMICLNMIVRNEAAVIRRCLESVKPFIDRWVIVDTGSEDDTEKIIREVMADKPGSLSRSKWVNFAHNRTSALHKAQEICDPEDYLLFIDADETLSAPEGFQWRELKFAAYHLHAEYAGVTYSRGALVSARRDWRWEGPVHEYLTVGDGMVPFVQLDQPRIIVGTGGARSRDPDTYAKDAALLEKALIVDPNNARNAFYLAQSYRDMGELKVAYAAYRNRSKMEGWAEETWYAMYEMGRLAEKMASSAEVHSAYLAAFQYRPTRAEPLYELARYHRERGELHLAHLFARQAITIKRPEDRLFVNDSVYQWRALDEFSVAAYWVGSRAEGRVAVEKMLECPQLPDSDRARLRTNHQFYTNVT